MTLLQNFWSLCNSEKSKLRQNIWKASFLRKSLKCSSPRNNMKFLVFGLALANTVGEWDRRRLNVESIEHKMLRFKKDQHKNYPKVRYSSRLFTKNVTILSFNFWSVLTDNRPLVLAKCLGKCLKELLKQKPYLQIYIQLKGQNNTVKFQHWMSDVV